MAIKECPELFENVIEDELTDYSYIEAYVVEILDGTFWEIKVKTPNGEFLELLLLSYFEGAVEKLNELFSEEYSGSLFHFTLRRGSYFDKKTQEFKDYLEIVDLVRIN